MHSWQKKKKKIAWSESCRCMSPISLLSISLPNSTVIPPKKQANDGSDLSIQLCGEPTVSLLQQEALRVGEVGERAAQRNTGRPLERRSASEQMLPAAPGASLHSSGPSVLCALLTGTFSSHVTVGSPHQTRPYQHRSLLLRCPPPRSAHPDLACVSPPGLR